MLQLSVLLLQLDRSGRYKESGCSSVRHYASSVLGLSMTEVRRFLLVAKQLEALPAFKKASEEGRLSWYAVHTIAQHATPATEARWVQIAEAATADQLQDLVRKKEEQDGHLHVRWKLETVTLRMLDEAWTRLSEQHKQALTRNESLQFMAAQVLGTKSEGLVTSEQLTRHRTRAAEEGAGIDLPGEHAPEKSDGPIELTKIGSITPDSKIRFNPKARGVTPAQRRELRRRAGYCCATPGCSHRLWLHVHHLKFFSNGGETEPGNLVLLCSACHRLLHHQHLIIQGRPPNELRFFNRKGEELRGSRAPALEDSS